MWSVLGDSCGRTVRHYHAMLCYAILWLSDRDLVVLMAMVWREEKGRREDGVRNADSRKALEMIITFAMGTAILAFYHVISFMLHASVRDDQSRILRSDGHVIY